ncbi:MAG: class I adenylate-forming enzyme family protein [bacterium]
MDNEKQHTLAAAIERFPTFSEIVDHTSRKFPDQLFLIEGEHKWTYAAFNKMVNQCCYFLQSEGLGQGDIISVILRNSIDYLLLYFAALRSRIILNPFPFHLSGEEVLSKVEIISPKIIFCHRNHIKALSKSPFIVRNLDECEGGSFIERVQKYPINPFPSPDVDTTRTAIMYYSSGTTGSPKIIEYSYKSMVVTQASMLRSGFTTPGSVHICVLPLGHTASLRYTIQQCICTGSTVVLYESFWKVRANLWDEIERHKVTFIEIVPSIIIAILNTPYKNFTQEKVATIDFIGCGSSFLPQNLQEAFEHKFGIPLANLYGLSETGATHFDNPREPGRRAGSIGRPFDIVDVVLFDENRQEVKEGELGEFGIKGPGLLKGYYKNHKLYEESFHNGYFMTGDLGVKDKEGLYYYCERKKDLIIKGGVNIVPSQIDETLISHPSIKEAATIGKPDILLGETIKSYVVVKDGFHTDSKELKIYCKEKLGDFKTPAEFVFIDALPKGPSGKILKRELREREGICR